MKPIKCQTVHNPPVSYGDCLKACVASILEDENVPHVFDGRSTESSWTELRKYIHEKHAKRLALFVVDDPWEFMEVNNSGIHYIVICRVSGGDHAVVCKNGEVVHDPAFVKKEIVGPSSIGQWVVGVFVCE